MVGLGKPRPVRYITGEDISTVIHDVSIASQALEGANLSEYRLFQKAFRSASLRQVRPGGDRNGNVRCNLQYSWSSPLYRFLGGAPIQIETDVTIPMVSPERAREISIEMTSQGFTKFKVKVGKDFEEDAARVMAIFEGAPRCSFIIDANQGFTPDGAISFVRHLIDHGVKIDILSRPRSICPT